MNVNKLVVGAISLATSTASGVGSPNGLRPSGPRDADA